MAKTEVPRLKEEYYKKVRAELKSELGYKSVMSVPQLEKIVLNIGAGDAVDNSAVLDDVVSILATIAGQKPVVTKARRAIAGFKIREGNDIGAKVTMRGDKMWYFLDKLINVVFPRTKDFRGVSVKAFDGRGSYSIGIREHTVFPEIDSNKVQKIRSLQAVLSIKSKSDKDSKALLDKFGFPFVKEV